MAALVFRLLHTRDNNACQQAANQVLLLLSRPSPIPHMHSPCILVTTQQAHVVKRGAQRSLPNSKPLAVSRYHKRLNPVLQG